MQQDGGWKGPVWTPWQKQNVPATYAYVVRVPRALGQKPSLFSHFDLRLATHGLLAILVSRSHSVAPARLTQIPSIPIPSLSITLSIHPPSFLPLRSFSFSPFLATTQTVSRKMASRPLAPRPRVPAPRVAFVHQLSEPIVSSSTASFLSPCQLASPVRRLGHAAPFVTGKGAVFIF